MRTESAPFHARSIAKSAIVFHVHRFSAAQRLVLAGGSVSGNGSSAYLLWNFRQIPQSRMVWRYLCRKITTLAMLGRLIFCSISASVKVKRNRSIKSGALNVAADKMSLERWISIIGRSLG